jgi:hypothetical protein
LAEVVLSGSTDQLREGCSRTFTATLKDGNGDVMDDDSTLVSFAQIDGGGEFTFSEGSTSEASDGVATKSITATKNGGVFLQASVGAISSSLHFEIGPPGACGGEEFVVGFRTSDGPNIDPLAALATVLFALLGVAAVSARRSMQRLA